MCEFIRHQAASVDELRAEIQFPEYILGYTSIYKVIFLYILKIYTPTYIFCNEIIITYLRFSIIR